LLLAAAAPAPVPAQQLVFTPIKPCTFADTRFWDVGGEMTPGVLYNLKVTGDLSGQGGSSGCGVPFGTAKAIAVKLVVIGFSVESKGRLNLDPYPDGSGPAVINFGANLSDFDMSNSGIIPICNPSDDTCDYDLIAELPSGGPVHMVFSVQGYFREQSTVVTPPPPGAARSAETGIDSILIPDPVRSDRMIQYSSLEGPEAAIYFRGQARLVAGEAFVTFPDYFADLVVPASITVSLTPRSADSLGLAAVEMTADGFRVVELHTGAGEDGFDFVATGVRKGYEGYEVYRSMADFGKP